MFDMEAEFSFLTFYRCKKGWQIAIGDLKRFDSGKSWCIFRLTKQKNQRPKVKICD